MGLSIQNPDPMLVGLVEEISNPLEVVGLSTLNRTMALVAMGQGTGQEELVGQLPSTAINPLDMGQTLALASLGVWASTGGRGSVRKLWAWVLEQGS